MSDITEDVAVEKAKALAAEDGYVVLKCSHVVHKSKEYLNQELNTGGNGFYLVVLIVAESSSSAGEVVAADDPFAVMVDDVTGKSQIVPIYD